MGYDRNYNMKNKGIFTYMPKLHSKFIFAASEIFFHCIGEKIK